MINEGLGAGQINDDYQKKQLNSPISNKYKKAIKSNNMVEGIGDAKELGKEMEALKTNKEVKEANMVPDPIQHIE